MSIVTMAQITQESYDEVVKENMEEFSMTEEEAIVDAIKQFKTQGVDLSNIRTGDPNMAAVLVDTEQITDAIEKLRDYVKNKTNNLQDVVEPLMVLREQCKKNIETRVAVGKFKAYDVIVELLSAYNEEILVTKEGLTTLTALMTHQPDLLDARGVQYISTTMDACKKEEVIVCLLKWVKECCILHENNRQSIFNAGILDHLKPLLLVDTSSLLLRHVLAVLRALVLDDDVRVEFGRAHEHARAIASDSLCVITQLLDKHDTDEPLMGDLMITLSTLIVRNEFCSTVEEAGGTDYVIKALTKYQNNEKLVCQGFKLLKALAGNDSCKAHIVQKGAAPVISATLAYHQAKYQLALAGLQCVASLTLRSPDNCKILFDAGIPEVIIDCMKEHQDQASVQKSGCWAIRNMVSRNKDQCKTFISLGVEDILKEDLHKFNNKCEYDAKAALRDLGCEVNLKEEWTGKGGALTNTK